MIQAKIVKVKILIAVSTTYSSAIKTLTANNKQNVIGAEARGKSHSRVAEVKTNSLRIRICI
jgi:hypothetical protein